MASYKHVDIDHLNQMTDGSIDFMEDLIDMFFNQVPLFSQQLEEHCRAGDSKNLAKLAHRVKGSASMIGVRELSLLMKELENLATNGENQKILMDVIHKGVSIANEATVELIQIINELKNK